MLTTASINAISLSIDDNVENISKFERSPLYLVKNFEHSNNERVLKLLASGCEKTFHHTYDKHKLQINKVALRFLKSEVLAEEVVQEVFIKLWTERNKIKSGTPIQAWLYTVAKNNTINRLKKKANEWKAIDYLKNSQKTADNYTANMVQDAEYKCILNEALNSLSTNQLKVYQLARQENLSYIQIAKHLHISPLTVKTHMSRALAHLKYIFTGHGIL